jgi:hypothetical protein
MIDESAKENNKPTEEPKVVVEPNVSEEFDKFVVDAGTLKEWMTTQNNINKLFARKIMIMEESMRNLIKAIEYLDANLNNQSKGRKRHAN